MCSSGAEIVSRIFCYCGVFTVVIFKYRIVHLLPTGALVKSMILFTYMRAYLCGYKVQLLVLCGVYEGWRMLHDLLYVVMLKACVIDDDFRTTLIVSSVWYRQH